MKLRLGKMTSKEVAQWFKISYSTYRSQKLKRLQELKDYAEFEEVYGGIIINEILIEEYHNKQMKDDAFYLKEIKNSDNGLSSAAGMVRKLIDEGKLSDEVTIGTYEKRFVKARDRLFGDPLDKINKEDEWNKGGLVGKDKYTWAIKIDNNNRYRKLTSEEMDNFYNLVAEFYKSKKKELAAFALEKADKERWKNKTAMELLKREEEYGLSFVNVLKMFKDRYGFQLVKATEHMLENNEAW